MRALIGLGSNLGDRALAIGRARRLIGLAAAGSSAVTSSPLYESEPLDGPEQPDFLNAVIAVETSLGPERIFEWLKRIEITLGRVLTETNGPRVIDLDLLAIDDVVVSSDSLTVPHKRLARRRFVLEPLRDVAADWIHPTLGQSAAAMLAELPERPWVRQFDQLWWGE